MHVALLHCVHFEKAAEEQSISSHVQLIQLHILLTACASARTVFHLPV
jgi:hypothetical protein